MRWIADRDLRRESCFMCVVDVLECFNVPSELETFKKFDILENFGHCHH